MERTWFGYTSHGQTANQDSLRVLETVPTYNEALVGRPTEFVP